MRREPFKDLESGEKFGYWVVSKKVGVIGCGSVYECICACGLIRQIYRSNLVSGKTKSCGCMKPSLISASRTKHGMAGPKHSKIYAAWSSMMTRCFNERSKSWPNYGGRGISVCQRWQEFENFFLDMGEPSEGLSLDRIDPDGDYAPDNCRWANAKTQARNRRVVKLTEDVVAGMRIGLITPLEASAMTGCKKSTAYAARRGQNWGEI